MEMFGKSIALPDFPMRRDVSGWGMSDAGYVDLLSKKMNYLNTFYDREPRFDITETLKPGQENSLDFLISTEVFEHIAPPVSIAFKNAGRLLKQQGVLIFTVPFIPLGETREHFPELHHYEPVSRNGGNPILKNITRDGREQVFEDLVFHGGVGATLEMRVFSKEGIIRELEQAGFGAIKFYSEPYWEFGIYWSLPYSIPLTARPMPAA
jgi:SAM-dependent methyltransferase